MVAASTRSMNFFTPFTGGITVVAAESSSGPLEKKQTDQLLILRTGPATGQAIAKRNFESRRAMGEFADALEQHIPKRVDATMTLRAPVARP